MSPHTGVSASGGLLPGFRASVANAQLCEMDFPLADCGAAMTLESVRIDELSVARYRSLSSQSVQRRPDHIRRDRLDSFIVTLPLSADFHFSQHGNCCSVAPGAFALVSTAEPFEITERPHSPDHSLISMHVVVPGALLRERCSEADALCGRALPILPGAGQMMRGFIAAWLCDGALLSPTQAQSASELLVDLIASACSQHARSERGALSSPSNESRDRTLQSALRFIAAHLSDPELDTVGIARYCQVSVRQLQKVFESASISVAATIREKRLQACRDSFVNRELHRWTVSQIAARWGFNEPSQFSRAYKSRFGSTPTEERISARIHVINSAGR